MNILVVGSVLLQKNQMERNLHAAGFQNTYFASKASIGFDQLRSREINLLMMEPQLSDMHWTRMLGEVRKNADWLRLPIVIVTDEPTPAFVALANEMEVSGVLIKPFSSNDLKDKLARVMAASTKTGDVESTIIEARAFELAAKGKTAIEHLRMALKDDPENPKLLYAIGEYYRANNVHKDAEAYFRKALEKNPDHVRSLYGLGRLFLHMGDDEKAFEFMSKADIISPGYPERKRLLARVSVRRSERYLKQALEMDSHDPDTLHLRGKLAVLLDDPKTAHECFLKAQELYTKNPPSTLKKEIKILQSLYGFTDG